MPTLSKKIPLCAVVIALTAVFAITIHVASAQTVPSFGFTTEPIPLYAGDTAIVTVESNNFAVGSTSFTWYVNDVVIPSASGMGKNSIKIETVKGKSEIFIVRVLVDPGAGFEPTERQYIVAPTYVPIPAEIYNTQSQIRVSFKINAYPRDPSPGQTVKLSLETFSFDPNFAKIQWYVNDELIASGVGERSAETAVGSIGETYSIRADVTLPDGTINSETILLQVSNLSFYWWVDSIAPPWYKGKALPAPKSKISILALPEFPGTSPQNLSYRWKHLDSTLSKQSGFGKSLLAFTPQFEGVEETLSLTVKNFAGTISKEKRINVGADRPPTIHFYRLKPLEGIDYARTITSLELPAGETLDVAAELFHLPQQFRDSLRYAWALNGEGVPSKDPAAPGLLTIRSEEGAILPQFIYLVISNKTGLTSQMSNSFGLIYR